MMSESRHKELDGVGNSQYGIVKACRSSMLSCGGCGVWDHLTPFVFLVILQVGGHACWSCSQ